VRILVRHIPNTYNYGSLMMAITAIDYLNRYLEHAEFFVIKSKLVCKFLSYHYAYPI
jgi:hypothetical protein